MLHPSRAITTRRHTEVRSGLRQRGETSTSSGRMARCTVLYLGGQTVERLDEAGLVGRATFNGEAGRVPSAPRSALERGGAAF